MKTFADWYPGDGAALAGLEIFGIIAVLVGLTWAVERFVARRRAALCHALWFAALVGVLLAPAVVLFGRHLPWHVAVLPSEVAATDRPAEQPSDMAVPATPAGERAGEFAQASAGSGTTKANSSEQRPARSTPPAKVPTSGPAVPLLTNQMTESVPAAANVPAAPPTKLLQAIATLTILVWGLGIAFLAARLGHGSWRVRRLWRRLRPLDRAQWATELSAVARLLSVPRLPSLYLSPDVRSPLVAGLFPPRVVLPERLPSVSSPENLRAVLVHECAHVVRRDPWVRLLQQLASVLFWVHPLVYLLNRRLDRAREEVCDNHVLAHTDAPAYAETLLTVAQFCYPTPRLQGYLTMMPRHYDLERRVVDLLAERRDTATRLPAPQRATLLAALAALLVGISSVGLHGAAAQDKAAQAAPKGQPATEKLTGVIRAKDGKPAAGAIVWAAKLVYAPIHRRETVADAQGRYTLELDPGTWFVRARLGTQGGEGPSQHETVEIVAGKAPRPLAIQLEERGTFRGRLLESESGKPIPRGQLYLDQGLVLTADADGRFEVGGLPRTNHEAFVVAPGRTRVRVLFDTTGRADSELEVPVPRAVGKIVGRVTDLDGNPIPGAYVGRHTSGSFFSINALFVACDAEGRFAYDDAVPAGQPTWLGAAAPDYVEEERQGIIVPADGRSLELNFRLRPKPGTPGKKPAPDEEKRRTVSGVVREPFGKPAEGVLVRWGYQSFIGAIETRTDAQGRFRLTVPDKADMLAVLPRDFVPDFPAVEAGGDKTVNVTLQPGDAVRGQVRDDTGKPIPGVTVTPVTGSPEAGVGNPFWLSEASVRTDAEGKYHVKGLPNGARLDFLKAGLSFVRNYQPDFTAASNDVTMLYGGAVKGRVVDRDGKPIRNFRVLVNFPRERQAGDQTEGFFAGYSGMGVRFTSPDGSFVLTGVGAGSVYRIAVLADGHGEAVDDRVTAVPVNRLAATPATTLKAGPPVSLGVRAEAAGKPVAGALVTLVNGQPGLDRMFLWGYHDASWQNMSRGRTGADGWAKFPALSFGDATVLVRIPGYARQRLGWRNNEKELTFKLEREAVIAGEVSDAAGSPVKEFHVRLTNGDGGDQITASVQADDKGRFRVGELPAGEWSVTINAADGRMKLFDQQVTLKAGDTKDLKVVVAR
jgi:beta-lactamase regulating signal transducer with metallopeptidase domain